MNTTRNANADGAPMAHGDADCTIHAESVHDAAVPMVRLNCTSPWDTWVGVDLTIEQTKELARRLLHFVDTEFPRV